MKKFLAIIATVLCGVLMFAFTACNSQGGKNPPSNNYTRPSNVNIDETFTPTSNTLIAYFSKSNTTQGVAEKIREITNVDIFEIERKEPYPADYTPTTEVAQDEKNANARPELALYISDEAMAQYDTIILGFPIWWHTAPMPVLSFLNYYDVSGKTIYTFCTSGGSSISESTTDVRNNAKDATVVEGRRFSSVSDTNIQTWLNGLNLNIVPIQPETPVTPEQPSEATTILVAYFSWSGTTTRLARHIGEQIQNATMYQIERETPYSDDYNTVAYGEAKDEADSNARPPIKNPLSQDEMSEYDVIILAYPIWWHTAPMVVGTFLESYDLSGVDIYPITQSASMSTSQFNESFEFVTACAKNATVHEGLGTKDTSEIDDYLREYGLI